MSLPDRASSQATAAYQQRFAETVAAKHFRKTATAPPASLDQWQKLFQQLQ